MLGYTADIVQSHIQVRSPEKNLPSDISSHLPIHQSIHRKFRHAVVELAAHPTLQEELGVTDNPEKVGFYSGLVVSSPHTSSQRPLLTLVGIDLCIRPILHSIPLGQVIRVSVPVTSTPLPLTEEAQSNRTETCHSDGSDWSGDFRRFFVRLCPLE